MKTFLLVLLVILSAASVVLAQTQSELTYKEIPNFHKVNDYIYRGGEPKQGGFQRLKELGVTTVVNLRDDDARARAEAEEAKALGLRYFNIPLSNFHRPSDKTVEDVLKILGSPDHQAIFVHCKRGSDRTGLIIAIYRMMHDGWNTERAKAEAKQFGLGFWQIEMKDYINDYYERHVQRNNSASPQM